MVPRLMQKLLLNFNEGVDLFMLDLQRLLFNLSARNFQYQYSFLHNNSDLFLKDKLKDTTDKCISDCCIKI